MWGRNTSGTHAFTIHCLFAGKSLFCSEFALRFSILRFGLRLFETHRHFSLFFFRFRSNIHNIVIVTAFTFAMYWVGQNLVLMLSIFFQVEEIDIFSNFQTFPIYLCQNPMKCTIIPVYSTCYNI